MTTSEMMNTFIIPVISLIFLQFTSSSILPDSTYEECRGNVADVVFILDSSASIYPPDFDKQILFVEGIVDKFNIGPQQIRVGVETFGETNWLKFHLNQYSDADSLKKAVKAIKFRAGKWTNTGAALKFARETMFTDSNGDRPNIPNIAVVITDGKSTEHKITKKEAEAARKAGIQIFAIGVGKHYDRQELEDMATKPSDKYVFTVDNYKALDSIIETFTSRTCTVIRNATTTIQPTTTTTTTEPTTKHTPTFIMSTHTRSATTQIKTTRLDTTLNAQSTFIASQQNDGEVLKACGGKPADIYFVMDSSRSIGYENYQKQKEFVKRLVGAFDIGTDKTRIGVVSFSNNYRLDVVLGTKNDIGSLRAAIDNVPYHARGTNTGDALQFVRTVGFANGMSRRGVAQIMIVLTDGLSRFPSKTAQEASLAHDAGIYVFAIGIGRGVDKAELSSIASYPDSEFLFHVGGFDALQSIQNLLATRTCEQLPRDQAQQSFATLPPRQFIDIVFVYDIYGIGSRKASMIHQFILNVISSLDLQSGFVRVGRLVDYCPPFGTVNLGTTDSLAALTSSIRYPGISNMIGQLETYFLKQNNAGQYDAKQLAVVFLDEDEHDIKAAVKQIQRLGNMNVLVIILGDDEKYMITNTDNQKFVTLPDYNQLPQYQYSFQRDASACGQI